MKYPEERKQAVIAKMMPPHQKSLEALAEEERISVATLYHWRREARLKGILLPDHDHSPSGWSSADKFAAVLETALLNEVELGEYCRKRGLYPEQIKQWRRACEEANDWDRKQNDHLKAARKADECRVRELERELSRKEKALAEAATIIVLQKKLQTIWEEPEGE